MKINKTGIIGCSILINKPKQLRSCKRKVSVTDGFMIKFLYGQQADKWTKGILELLL